MSRIAIRLLLAWISWLVVLPLAQAHCDTLDGPVVRDVQRALESGDLAPVLKWIASEDEPAVRDAFAMTSTVRKQGGEAKALADRYLLETVVRIHRAGEGAPYEGLKPSGAISPTIAAADQALAAGSPDKLVRDLSGSVAEELRSRFQNALLRKAHADESVEAGRAFVAAYVDYVHFVEGLDGFLRASVVPGHDTEPPRHAH